MPIPDSAVSALKEIVREFLPRTDVPREGLWRELDDDAIWKNVVVQVVVVGGSAAWDERIKHSPRAQEALNFASLQRADSATRARIINRVLRDHGVRYASSDLGKCRKTAGLVRNFGFLNRYPGGPRAYLAFLNTLRDDRSRVDRVQRDLSYIKLKGARDLLAELGLVTDIIALDTRVLTLLADLGAELAPDVRTNAARYQELQDELIAKVCRPLRITGVALDRALYQNYNAIQSRIKARST